MADKDIIQELEGKMAGAKKLYCYVDETGQDTEGDIFVVSVIVPENRDELLEYLGKLEAKSGKHRLKWGRAKPANRLWYIEEIFGQRKYPLEVYYSVYRETKEYKNSTVLSIAKAIHAIEDFKEKQFTILIDGLNKKDQRYYGFQLHRLGVPARKVRGIRKDENDALIRLADAVCGFVRDVFEKEKGKGKEIYQKAIKSKILVEV